MALFELQRLWDAWGNIQNVQVLRDLFRQVSARPDTGEITGVFVIPGHLFVATSHTSVHDGSVQVNLYAFSCAPTKQPGTQSRDSHVTNCQLPLANKCSRIVNIVDNYAAGTQQVWVVHDNGEVSVFDYNAEGYHWTLRECLRLSLQSLWSCVAQFSSPSSPTADRSGSLLYCERVSERGVTENCFTVACRNFHVAPDGNLNLGAPTPLLSGAPPMSMWSFEGGACLLPAQGPSPHGLMFIWMAGGRSLEPYVWNGSLMAPGSSIKPGTAFKAVVLRLAGNWSKAVEKPKLVSMATHPVTNQLLALASDGSVYQIAHTNGLTQRKRLTKLTDFTLRYSNIQTSMFEHMSQSTTSDPTKETQLFCLHTYYGVCHAGGLRLYNSFTGEFVWECDDHEGVGTRLWTTPTFCRHADNGSCHANSDVCGVFNKSGVWVLRSKRIAEHATFMAHSPFPMATATDETHHNNGRVLAARLCKLWGLELLATKYALEAAYTVTKGEVEEEEEEVREGGGEGQPDLSAELLDLLTQSSLQNPALVVALLAEHPTHRHALSQIIGRFLVEYRQGNQDLTNQILTQLNTEIAPLLEKYQEMAQEYERILGQETSVSEDSCIPQARESVRRILSQSVQGSLEDSEAVALQSQFHSLCQAHPQEALQEIRDFLNVGGSFKEAVQQLQDGTWQSERNWRTIFASRSPSEVQKGYLQGSFCLPLFEVTCRLLYHTQPEELLDFVEFAQLARDYEARDDSTFARKCRKNFFYQRVLDALPEFISRRATPTSPQAIQAHCQLLLLSDHAHPEMAALRLLVSNRMWSEAVELVERSRDSNLPPTTFTSLVEFLLTQLSRGGVLRNYLDRVWRLLPENFGIFDFLNVLKMGRHWARGDPLSPVLLPEHSPDIAVAAVVPKALELLQNLRIE